MKVFLLIKQYGLLAMEISILLGKPQTERKIQSYYKVSEQERTHSYVDSVLFYIILPAVYLALTINSSLPYLAA